MILTLDIGSSSVRAGLYNREAQPEQGLSARRAYEFSTTADGGAEVEADFLFKLVCQVIDEVLAKAAESSKEIIAVAVSLALLGVRLSLVGTGRFGRKKISGDAEKD